jgi:hypothetical protein
MAATREYEIRAFSAEGTQLNLNGTREAPDHLAASTVFEALAVVAGVPQSAMAYWDDAEDELTVIARIELWHGETVVPVRGQTRHSDHLLETFKR